jgi:Amidase
MKKPNAVSTDCNLDRRTVLKLGAGISAFAVAGPVSAAVLANNNEIVALSARAGVDYVRRGELSTERYVQVLLDRYKAHTNLNTVTYIDEARLLEDAREIDRARARGAQLGPLAGLPMMLKDNINTVGFPTTAGTTFLKDYRPKTDAPLANMLFKQGAILFAKSNMHELALGSTSANPTFGYVKNPYDLSRIPGGSSGGTAAAVAARIVPAGLGSDTTGSIRMPSHFCGIAGLRPSNPKTNKPYPVEGIVPLQLEFDVAGPMARNVADVALIHAAITQRQDWPPARLLLGNPRCRRGDNHGHDAGQAAWRRRCSRRCRFYRSHQDGARRPGTAAAGGFSHRPRRIPCQRISRDDHERSHSQNSQQARSNARRGCMGASSVAGGRGGGAVDNGRPGHSIFGRIPATEYRRDRLPDHAVSGTAPADRGRCPASHL